ncbi:hypothetical protein DL239_15315 [Sedimentitalea sp. CY04]|uniref:Tyr recombinase domain-containing protein n=1 Tax=Parasedimentitalea denitrificans TaxID=2211118 RepID=A0ABX0WDN3_9RHOB|nr:site-specific integrase [Sedimentitalea sp. CY04]NIZ62341.1 hypothetical protein [Sedimentitalea sp. CY04]
MEQVERALSEGKYQKNVSSIMCALRQALATEIESGNAPSPKRLREILERRSDEIGHQSASTEFGYLQIGAAHIWGAEETAHFGRVLREFRVSEKAPAVTKWERVEGAIPTLPREWHQPMFACFKTSNGWTPGKPKHAVWSPDYFHSVVRALARWAQWCGIEGSSLTPTGQAFDAYASYLVDSDVTPGTVGNYLDRIISGFAVVLQPGFSSQACLFVRDEWKERAKKSAPKTKSGNQLVSAKAIYDFGFDQIEMARKMPVRNLSAAILFRNGLLHIIGIALPERARALSHLKFDTTICLLEFPLVRVSLPGSALKRRQTAKHRSGYTKVFENPKLWEVLVEYRSDYRPIFDGGNCLFPSKNAVGQRLASGRIGQIVGNATKKRFGVRITIHRFRDNVATDASEELENGAMIGAGVLGHKSQETMERHYDHSTGSRAAKDLADFVGSKQNGDEELKL